MEYKQKCSLCEKEKHIGEFLKRLGRNTNRCLECSNKITGKYYTKKMKSKFEHPWIKDFKSFKKGCYDL